MVKNCEKIAKELANYLTEQGYSDEAKNMADKLSKLIGEEAEDKGENVPVVKTVGDEKEEIEEVSDESVDDEDIRDMPLEKHKDMLKKKKIIITME